MTLPRKRGGSTVRKPSKYNRQPGEGLDDYMLRVQKAAWEAEGPREHARMRWMQRQTAKNKEKFTKLDNELLRWERAAEKAEDMLARSRLPR